MMKRAAARAVRMRKRLVFPAVQILVMREMLGGGCARRAIRRIMRATSIITARFIVIVITIMLIILMVCAWL